jgi:hypothetical protein
MIRKTGTNSERRDYRGSEVISYLISYCAYCCTRPIPGAERSTVPYLYRTCTVPVPYRTCTAVPPAGVAVGGVFDLFVVQYTTPTYTYALRYGTCTKVHFYSTTLYPRY